jgi:hypothetical protein
MLTALLFRFPFPGPWGKELTKPCTISPPASKSASTAAVAVPS